MPLEKGSSQEVISRNIAELMRTGKHTQEQAAAIAYKTARGDAAPIKASGIIYRAGNKVLLLKRTSEGDCSGTWALPGGKAEADEDHTAAAIRESTEEIGFTPEALNLRAFNYSESGSVNYLTFTHRGDEFEPKLNDEHSEYQWSDLDHLPEPMHPAVAPVLERLNAPVVTETDVANQIARGELSSPQRFDNMWLWALRITGTGTTYRSALDEYAYRRPEIYLTDEFLARCNGLPVIWDHPPEKSLDSKEFAKRIIGTILLPYIQGDEVWGIARIYDDEAASEMLGEQLSTSPNVVFHNLEVNDSIALDDGTLLLIEGKPGLLDHLAVCVLGVWDKGGPPSGILSETVENAEMPKKIIDDVEVEVADSASTTDPAVLALLQQIASRQDSQDAAIAELSKRTARADAGDGGRTAADMPLADADETEEEKTAREAKEAKEKADAEEMDKIKADAEETKKKMADMESKIPKADTDEDYQEMADAQARADSVANAFGQRAPGPLMGEKLIAYRKRLLQPFKTHSKAYADIDIAKIDDPAILAVVEKGIFADAMTEARNPTAIAGAGLREIHRTVNGRQITEFVGDSGECWAPFQSASRKIYGFNQPGA